MNQRPPLLFVLSSRGKWTSAGGVVWDERDRIGLVLQPDRSGEARWTLPKGRLDPGESLEEAAAREVLEETGLRTRVVGYLGVHEGKRSFVHYFQMRVVRYERAPDPLETLEVRFVTVARARELLRSARDRRVLQSALAEVRYDARRVAPLRRRKLR